LPNDAVISREDDNHRFFDLRRMPSLPHGYEFGEVFESA
jgi:hypothetical protein